MWSKKVQEPWQEIAARKRAAVQALIPTEWLIPAAKLEEYKKWGATKGVMHVPRESGVLSEEEIEITEAYDAVALAEELRTGKLSAVDVTRAFSKRAAVAHQLVNCLTEVFFTDAIARADYLDEYLKREGKPIGPFHGLPISIKDGFKYPGVESTQGYVSNVGSSTATEPSPFVQLLLDLGAVLYVKTNIPQTLMTADTDNNVFGRTLNPHKLTITAGGSSGGEGALIALKGSILGVGTDIGGSIRIPAYCCGIYGFKPTAGRTPSAGQQPVGRAGSPGIITTAGPLARSFRDLEFFTKAVINAVPQDYDSSALGIPWIPAPARNGPLKIGVLPEDPEFPLMPPVKRTLATAIEKLKAAGHAIIPLTNAPSTKEASDITIALFNIDPTKSAIKRIQASGEPFIQSILNIFADSAAQAAAGVKQRFPLPEGGYTLESLWDLNAAKADYAERWNQVLVKEKVDVIVGPVAEMTAGLHDTYGNAPYTMIWNLLNYPGVVIPFLKADQSIDKTELFPTGLARNYNASDVDGIPCGIQLTARGLRDENLLAASRIVASVLES